MLFNSFIFFIFLAVVLPTYYILPTKKSKNIFLLLSSYFFYGFWDWRFTSLLAFSTIIDFFIGKYLFLSKNKKRRKRLLIISLVSNLGILSVFKYFNFFIDSFEQISQSLGFELDYLHLNIILPVGISFYTFQTLSYTIDIYRKKISPTNNFIDFALFISFFPQLVAGPIERAKRLLPQFSKKNHPTKLQIQEGIVLIITGLFRKVMIGDVAGRYVDNIFSSPEIYPSFELFSALIMFSIQIYADFSGYSHIARGTGKLLGIELMKNFEQPYFSKNITEFWRRWHISLSSWLKDYLYISLGGNRKGVNKTYRNLIITMLIGGLWHGAGWNFVIWGGIHGAYLAIHKLLMKNIKNETEIKNNFIKTAFNILVTYFLVLFAWLFFRAENLDTVFVFFNKFIHFEASDFNSTYFMATLSFILLISVLDYFELKFGHTFILKIKSKPIQYGILSALFIIVCLFMLQSDPLPFIYFQF